MANKTSSPDLFNAQLWSGTHTQTDDPTPAPKSPLNAADPPSGRRSVSFQVDHNPFITVDPSISIYDHFPVASAISPASTASPLPVSPHHSPVSVPLHTLAAVEPSGSPISAQAFDAFSWSAAITPHDYASAPQPYTPGHPANVAHREAMEREAYDGADPEDADEEAPPSRKSSSSSRRRASGDRSAATSAGPSAGTSVAHAKFVTSSVKAKSHARKMSVGHILRPRNAFIIFRSTMIKEGQITENMEASCLVIDRILVFTCLLQKDHGNISTICGILWRKLSPSEKLKYQRMADLEKEQHRLANPGYKYAPKTRKEPPARRRQKKDQDIVARRCALAAALLAEGRRGSEMTRELEHFDKEIATQIKKEKEDAARMGIRTDPYAHAHSAKKLKRLEKERKDRERAMAAQASAANLREGVLAMHAQADAQAAENRHIATGPSNMNAAFSRTPRNAYTPVINMPPPSAPNAAPAWTNPWASASAPDMQNMGRRPSSCPPPAAGNMAIPSLPTVPPIYNDYVSPTQPHAPHLVLEDMSQSSHAMNASGPTTAPPLHHPQPHHDQGYSSRRRSSSVPPPSLYAAPAQPFASRNGNDWEPGTRRPSVVFSMELERRPSQVQWNDDMGMGDARRPSIAGQSLGLGLGGWNRRPSAMLWTQERRMSAQAPQAGSNNSWYSNEMNAPSHLEDAGEPRIDFGNYSFQTATANNTSSFGPTNGGLAGQHLPPTAGPDQSYQFPPPTGSNDVDMYPNMDPSPFGAILAQQNPRMTWQPQASTMSPPPNGYSHAPHTPETDYSHPHFSQQPNNHYGVPGVQVHEPTWSTPINNDQSVPHTPIGSSPHTGIDDEGDMFQAFGEEEVSFPALNSAPRAGSEVRGATPAYSQQQTKSLPPYSNSLSLGSIIHENAIGGEDDLVAYSQAAGNIPHSGYNNNWGVLNQVDE
ncbi:unnamed protein product [Rhizoctonia solani]|uniref:HMG box domain-containing protein n=1 Tax=Rhizoctonia solani TaxID=456999 RepID=A0A8H3E8D4_9AGAM|nr:unnamed protein product [Rhizoctonia solani]